MRKFGKILFIGGLILTIAALAFGIGGIVYAVQSGVGVVRDSPSGDAAATVQAEDGEQWYVFAETPTLAECTATGPDGVTVEVNRPGSSMSFDFDNTKVYRVGEFTTEAAGEYAITCAPDIGTIRLVEADRINGTFTWLIAAPFLIVFSIFSGLATLLGLILWLIGRSREKNPPTPPPPGGGYPAGPGFPPAPGAQPGPGGYPGPGQPPYPQPRP